jgi:hypothetical protein
MAQSPFKYRAIRNCFHKNYYYTAGQEYKPTPDEIENDKVPEHFVKERDYSVELVEEAEVADRERTAVVKPAKKKESAK